MGTLHWGGWGGGLPNLDHICREITKMKRMLEAFFSVSQLLRERMSTSCSRTCNGIRLQGLEISTEISTELCSWMHFVRYVITAVTQPMQNEFGP